MVSCGRQDPCLHKNSSQENIVKVSLKANRHKSTTSDGKILAVFYDFTTKPKFFKVKMFYFSTLLFLYFCRKIIFQVIICKTSLKLLHSFFLQFSWALFFLAYLAFHILFIRVNSCIYFFVSNLYIFVKKFLKYRNPKENFQLKNPSISSRTIKQVLKAPSSLVAKDIIVILCLKTFIVSNSLKKLFIRLFSFMKTISCST